jgi:hypothetical protein
VRSDGGKHPYLPKKKEKVNEMVLPLKNTTVLTFDQLWSVRAWMDLLHIFRETSQYRRYEVLPRIEDGARYVTDGLISQQF